MGLLISVNSYAGLCTTTAIPPHDRDKLVQSGYSHDYTSVHQFKILNNTNKIENYRLCRSLLINSNYPYRDIKNECQDISLAPNKSTGLIELKLIVSATNGPIFGGVDYQFKNVAVSAITGNCIASDMHDSVTTIFV